MAEEEGAYKNENDQDITIQRMELECLLRKKQANETSFDVVSCPMIWDGILCWPNTPAGNVMTLPCPSYVVGFDSQALATKRCMSDGDWYWSLEANGTWTNYSSCYSNKMTNIIRRFPDIENASLIGQYVPLMKAVSHVGYGVSLVTLIVAFCVLATFKRLRCPRNKLHMHLFVSFMLRAFTTLLKDTLFVRGVGLPSDLATNNGESYFLHENDLNWQCKVITSLWQYFIMANYSWILMEGLYLHNLIFFAVFSDTSSITIYVILGWGLPVLFVVPWVIVRALLENNLCWTTNDNPYYFLIIKGPTSVSILVNIILFINIVRVLMLKLRASICEETRRFRYRRWAKSTMVLVPLFGVHYVVFMTMSYIGVSDRVELVWLFIDQLFASFQGFFVAVLYCLLNGEVRSEIAKKWRHLPFWRDNYDYHHRPSLPLNTLPNRNKSRNSYLGAVFSKRRRFRNNQNGRKRGSNAESCMTTLVSSVPADLNSSTFVSQTCATQNTLIVPEITENSCAEEINNTFTNGLPK